MTPSCPLTQYAVGGELGEELLEAVEDALEEACEEDGGDLKADCGLEDCPPALLPGLP